MERRTMLNFTAELACVLISNANSPRQESPKVFICRIITAQIAQLLIRPMLFLSNGRAFLATIILFAMACLRRGALKLISAGGTDTENLFDKCHIGTFLGAMNATIFGIPSMNHKKLSAIPTSYFETVCSVSGLASAGAIFLARYLRLGDFKILIAMQTCNCDARAFARPGAFNRTKPPYRFAQELIAAIFTCFRFHIISNRKALCQSISSRCLGDTQDRQSA
jgi:hypothetical protein